MNYQNNKSAEDPKPKQSILETVNISEMGLEEYMNLFIGEDGKAHLTHLDQCHSTEIMTYQYWRNLSPQEKEKEFNMVASSIIIRHWGGDATRLNFNAVGYLLAFYDRQPGNTKADLLNAWKEYKIARSNKFQTVNLSEAPRTFTTQDFIEHIKGDPQLRKAIADELFKTQAKKSKRTTTKG